jgi:hypothetical protein
MGRDIESRQGAGYNKNNNKNKNTINNNNTNKQQQQQQQLKEAVSLLSSEELAKPETTGY